MDHRPSGLGACPRRSAVDPVKNTERGGFEPPNEVNPRYAISSRARSTAPAPLRAVRSAGSPPAVRVEGYDTRRRRRLLGSQAMILAASEAFTKTFGLAVTFGGIGIIVTIIVVYIAVQIRGERSQNKEYAASRSANGAGGPFPPSP